MKEALISIEDSRFYQHGPIDIQGTIRALLVNEASNATIQGGSSLTQQLVKLTLLNNATTAKQQRAATAQRLRRKFQELRYAVWVEDHSRRTRSSSTTSTSPTSATGRTASSRPPTITSTPRPPS